MTVELIGRAITEIRDFPAVAAILGSKLRGGVYGYEWPPVVSGQPRVEPPGIIVRKLAPDLTPFGRGSRRLGLQRPLYVALCYGAVDPTNPTAGYLQAAQLAGAVVDALNLRGPRIDAQGRAVHLSLVEGGSGASLDPVTKWPHETVTFTFIGSAQAVPIGA